MRKKTPMPHVELYPHELLVLNIAANLWRANAQVHHQLQKQPSLRTLFQVSTRIPGQRQFPPSPCKQFPA